VTGVTHLLINKQKSRADWSPSNLASVKEADIQRNFFGAEPATSFPVPQLDQPEGESYKEYPHSRYALPSEEFIGSIVRGETKGSGNYALMADDVHKRVRRDYPSKVGLKEKVDEVLARKTKKAEDGTLKWVYDD
jgi:3-hydroxyisobutyryl-CoA hydrolase